MDDQWVINNIQPYDQGNAIANVIKLDRATGISDGL